MAWWESVRLADTILTTPIQVNGFRHYVAEWMHPKIQRESEAIVDYLIVGTNSQWEEYGLYKLTLTTWILCSCFIKLRTFFFVSFQYKIMQFPRTSVIFQQLFLLTFLRKLTSATTSSSYPHKTSDDLFSDPCKAGMYQSST